VSQSFRVTAKALLFYDNRILLIRKPEGVWDLPGGRLDAGEHPEQALKREIKEELGISAEVQGIVDCSMRVRGEGQLDIFVVSYRCKTKADFKDIRLSHEHTDARLFAPAAVPGLAMHDTYKTAVRRGFQGMRSKPKGEQLRPSAMQAFSFLLKSRVFEAS
jgi:8-oxo-dGTP pyrophosphatase MutT (NUDIX family)